MRKIFILFVFTLSVINFKPAQSEPLRDVVITATYGMIAGSLVGLATLAFESNASDHYRNIAMGASLGLYSGILLGAYVAYFVDLKQPTYEPQARESYLFQFDNNKSIINFPAFDIIKSQKQLFSKVALLKIKF